MNGPCVAFETELSAYLDGELGDADRARVESHVRGCARCTAEIHALERVGNVLRRWDAHETRYAPSHGFRNRVLSRLGLPQEAGAAAPSAARLALFRPAGLAAAAAVFAALATWAAVRPGSTGDRAAFERLETEVAELRATVDRLARTPPGRMGTPSAARASGAASPIDVARLDPPRSVVSPPRADDPAAASEPPADSWEVLDEGTLLRSARESLDDYRAERRSLTIAEKLAQRDADAGATSTGPRGGRTAAAAAPTPVAALLGNAKVSDVAFPSFEHVQVWPIEVTPAPRAGRDLLTAADAIKDRTLDVREEPDGAVVARNGDPKGRPVLVLAGDVLWSNRQDRIVREEVLVPAGREVVVRTYASGKPKGRTSFSRFLRSGLVAPSGVRALVGASLLGENVGQGTVDEAVQSATTAFGSNGGDGSLDRLWLNIELQGEIRRTADAFRSRLDRPNVVGFAVAVGPRLVALEICGDPQTFRAVGDRVLRSHLLHAISRPGDEKSGPSPDASAVTALLDAARRAAFDDPGVGADGALSAFRSADGDVFGHGLVADGRVVHAVVFAGMPGGGPAAIVGGGRGGRARPGSVPGVNGGDRGGSGPGRATEGGGSGLDDR